MELKKISAVTDINLIKSRIRICHQEIAAAERKLRKAALAKRMYTEKREFVRHSKNNLRKAIQLRQCNNLIRKHQSRYTHLEAELDERQQTLKAFLKRLRELEQMSSNVK